MPIPCGTGSRFRIGRVIADGSTGAEPCLGQLSRRRRGWRSGRYDADHTGADSRRTFFTAGVRRVQRCLPGWHPHQRQVLLQAVFPPGHALNHVSEPPVWPGLTAPCPTRGGVLRVAGRRRPPGEALPTFRQPGGRPICSRPLGPSRDRGPGGPPLPLTAPARLLPTVRHPRRPLTLPPGTGRRFFGVGGAIPRWGVAAGTRRRLHGRSDGRYSRIRAGLPTTP